ncbi:hypothetical protein BU24DRAFT_429272 [Aaosphaeria arxii CBS 175.79]|uniref:Rhodopsin domain-containing protein n=1 Tax=Aaosphaeria arxii CBS 175.79 TaxID=1450172 RepID=A0A6A5X6W3_9PLEO|nr:uncharacterized protein BU24DRAFT_429272 [Aaosphaeria arxii CBS 175.79]KAF2008703.1 hypothetical protein BU24DRAFT_429272 [Aaosphaeria arxii CBS 175.79]
MSTPPSHEPNYDDRGPGLIVMASISIAVSTIAVVVRLWSQLVVTRRRLGWDDVALLFTLLFSHLTLGTLIAWVYYGFGKHQWMVPIQNMKSLLLCFHLYKTWYNTVIWLMKLSALTLYARLFRVSKRMRQVLWGFGVIVTLWWAAIAVTSWMECHPRMKTLDPTIPGECPGLGMPYYYALAIINPIFDFIILLLPVPLIWQLYMPTGKKLLVVAVMLFGYSSAFLSLGRFIIIVRRPELLASYSPTADPTWDNVPLIYVSSLEAPFAIVALSGPPVNQFLKRAKQFGWRSLLSSREYPSHQYASHRGNFVGGGNSTKGSRTTAPKSNNNESEEDILGPVRPQYEERNETLNNHSNAVGGNSAYLDLNHVPLGAIRVDKNISIVNNNR